MFVSLLKKIFNPTKSDTSNRELYVGNIHYHVRPHELRKFFEKYGDIESLKIIRDPRTKRSKGYGFVKFKKSTDAATAQKQTNAFNFKGRELCVDYSKSTD